MAVASERVQSTVRALVDLNIVGKVRKIKLYVQLEVDGDNY